MKYRKDIPMLKSLVTACRSIRSFDESHPVTKDDLLELIDTSRLVASAANRQPLKYRIITGDECKKVQPLTAWAGALPELELPPIGSMPTAFILICHDTNVSQSSDYAWIDVGISAQTLALDAADNGIGCCMIASFGKEIRTVLGLPENLLPRLLIAFGYPAETAVICAPKNGDVKYFRDDAGLHFVPKRPLDEVVILGAEE